ncbi:MAG: plasmid pRiA4b ORF-3 family protein [Clostridiales bacterium]|nr:plasmid pRiA4b ORF-3 family protein [Clostridiales bacterium]
MIQIGCTKKLIDYLGISPSPASKEIEPLFGFSANLIILNRRKCVAVANNATGCGFLLYGITASDKKKLQELLEAGLRNMLASENITKDVIDRYIGDCCFPASLCKTVDRSSVAKLNKFCQRIEFYENCFEPDDRFQTLILPDINYDIRYTADKKDSYETCEEQERFLKEKYGKLYNTRAGVFEISLELETPCLRRVMIPMDFSLFYLHDIIQNLFSWENCHLHEFILKQAKNGRPLKIAKIPFPDDEDIFGASGIRIIDEREITLEEVFSKNDSIYYEYDFGDGWTHEVRLVEMIDDADIPAPICTELKGDAPPEDCGGPYGFSELVRVLNDPKDPEYDDAVNWNGGTKIYQKSIKWINRNLRRRYLAGAFNLYYEMVYDEE